MALERWIAGALLATLVSLWAPRAEAEAAQDIAEARRLVTDFEYDQALERLEAAASDSRATAAQRIEALELAGVVRFNLRQQDAARETFQRMLTLDPGHQPSDPAYSPRVLAFIGQTRDAFTPEGEVTVVSEPPEVTVGEETIPLQATASGPTEGIDQAVAYVRTTGEGSYRQVPMVRLGSVFSVTVDAPSGGLGVEYYVELRAPSGYVLARGGSEAEPIGVVQSPPEPVEPVEPVEPERRRGRWYTSWWFWTIVGAVVAGGTATAVVLTLPPSQEEGTLGSYTLH